MTMVRANIRLEQTGKYGIYCQRDKYKHWFELGKHRETDAAFKQALLNGNWCGIRKLLGKIHYLINFCKKMPKSFGS